MFKRARREEAAAETIRSKAKQNQRGINDDLEEEAESYDGKRPETIDSAAAGINDLAQQLVAARKRKQKRKIV